MTVSILFRIGARGSPLSRAQVARMTALMAARFNIDAACIAFVPIVTSGDRIQDRPLADAGGKGLFTKELDEALRDRRIDLAVHSMKDVPTILPDDIALAAVPEREDPRDAFVSFRARSLAELPQGARLGTASVRRQAQALHARSDLTIEMLRGNVETRLRKIEDGVVDATFLALAGLKRLGLERHATSLVDPELMPPAAGQGALAITARVADAPRFAALSDARALLETSAERAFLAALDGSCRTPIAALARYESGALSFIGEALTANGARRWRREARAPLALEDVAQAAELGARLGRDIAAEAGDALDRTP